MEMMTTALRWLRPVTTRFIMWAVTKMKIRVYSAWSKEKRNAAVTRSTLLNTSEVVPGARYSAPAG